MDNRLKDFRNVLYICWKHLNLPNPTPVQYDIADYLQNGPDKLAINAFRGVGKSWITVAFVCWVLLLNPNKKIQVISASRSLADNFSTACLNLINTCALFESIRPPEGDRSWRNSKIQFDVKGSDQSKDPSLRSEGITGQITGTRADIIIADDIETPQTIETQHKREKLFELVKEFESIMKVGGRIIYLGTPHTEDSLYRELENREYKTRIWPARVPTRTQLGSYGEKLAPMILDGWSEDTVGDPTDPDRFDEPELARREISYGKAGFALQFMLDTSLSDVERYPLKLKDLIVDDLDSSVAYEKYVWANAPEQKLSEIDVCLGMRGDAFHRPMQRVGQMLPYNGAMLYIDPSGTGKDETGYAITKFLNGFVFVMETGGLQGGYSEKTLNELLDKAMKHKVNLIQVETNFGDGMFEELLKGQMMKRRRNAETPEDALCSFTVESIRVTTQKEMRIADTLEPVMGAHRLIFDRKIIKKDWDSTAQYTGDVRLKYSLFYQMTRLTREKGVLRHDDRLDALAGAVAYWVNRMSLEADSQMDRYEETLLEKELNDFVSLAKGQSRAHYKPRWNAIGSRNLQKIGNKRRI